MINEFLCVVYETGESMNVIRFIQFRSPQSLTAFKKAALFIVHHLLSTMPTKE
ncbi:MAG: hypothetical protein HZB10_03930 [Candidatus Yonathbacteria bacterium]|nr:hypothetical protein [Candidatus Yonathbacteria bacterium]